MGAQSPRAQTFQTSFVTLLSNFYLQFVSHQFPLPFPDEPHVEVAQLIEEASIGANVPVLPNRSHGLH